jgi:hypothetical protein
MNIFTAIIIIICSPIITILKKIRTTITALRKNIYATKQEKFEIAIQYNDIKQVKLLLNDPRVKPYYHSTYSSRPSHSNFAINCASQNGYTEIFSLLLQDARIKLNITKESLVWNAAEKGHNDIVKLLLNDKRVNTTDLNSAIAIASLNGHTFIVRILLEDKRAEPSYNNNESIRNASGKGYTDIVELLLNDSRVDPSDSLNKAIESANKLKYSKITKLLLKDKRVRNSLKKQNSDLYNILVKDKINSF